MPFASGIYYTLHEGGQKELPPVILLHCVGGSQTLWPAPLRRLNGQRVIALDLPGHGRSNGFGLQSISAYADQLVNFLAALELYQAVFIGHDMGGAIALEMALRHPNHVAGIGLIASGAYLGVDPEMLAGFANPITINGALHMFQQRAFSATTSTAVIERCIETLKATRSSVLAADWYACAQFDQRNSVTQVSAPALIITGSEDRMTPVAYAHFLSEHIPTTKLHILPRGGHMIILEQPDPIAQALQQFLAAVAIARRISP